MYRLHVQTSLYVVMEMIRVWEDQIRQNKQSTNNNKPRQSPKEPTSTNKMMTTAMI